VYDDAAGNVKVIVTQTQNKKFKLPLAIDIYNGAAKVRHNVWSENAADTFTFNYTKRPDLVNVDGDKILLWNKKDNKTLDNFIHQYKYAGNYVDRREAIDFAAKKQDDPKAIELLKTALTDKYFALRGYTIGKLDVRKDPIRVAVEPIIANLAKKDPYTIVRGAAITSLANFDKPEYTALFKTAVNDSSYTVSGNALTSLFKREPATALDLAKKLSAQPAKGSLKNAITFVIARSGDESLFDKMLSDFNKLQLQTKFNEVNNLGTYVANLKSMDKFKAGVDEIVKFRDEIPEALKGQTDPFLNGVVLKNILEAKSNALKEKPNDTTLQEQVNYIKSKLPEDVKKGF
jgi:aminopeptidase N